MEHQVGMELKSRKNRLAIQVLKSTQKTRYKIYKSTSCNQTTANMLGHKDRQTANESSWLDIVETETRPRPHGSSEYYVRLLYWAAAGTGPSKEAFCVCCG